MKKIVKNRINESSNIDVIALYNHYSGKKKITEAIFTDPVSGKEVSHGGRGEVYDLNDFKLDKSLLKSSLTFENGSNEIDMTFETDVVFKSDMLTEIYNEWKNNEISLDDTYLALRKKLSENFGIKREKTINSSIKSLQSQNKLNDKYYLGIGSGKDKGKISPGLIVNTKMIDIISNTVFNSIKKKRISSDILFTCDIDLHLSSMDAEKYTAKNYLIKIVLPFAREIEKILFDSSTAYYYNFLLPDKGSYANAIHIHTGKPNTMKGHDTDSYEPTDLTHNTYSTGKYGDEGEY